MTVRILHAHEPSTFMTCGRTNIVIIFLILFFFNDTATTEIYTLSLHDALPIFRLRAQAAEDVDQHAVLIRKDFEDVRRRSEEHTSELQSRENLVCRLLLEKKKTDTLKNLANRRKRRSQRQGELRAQLDIVATYR